MMLWIAAAIGGVGSWIAGAEIVGGRTDAAIVVVFVGAVLFTGACAIGERLTRA